MSITAATLQVRVDADASPAEAKLNSFSRALSGLATGAMMGVGMAAANAIGNAMRGAVTGMQDAVQAASDLSETVNMMNVVMGDSAQATLAWLESAATALGMSQQRALNAAATFATFGKSAGLAGTELTKFATGFVGLAADLASFRNTSPEQAITAIGAALRGESEPIRQYGVLLDDATLRLAAFNLGITDSIKNVLTPQQRVLAATAEMWRQTADAQGDAERTGMQLAGQQRQLAANLENLSATMGQAFLPVVLQTTTALNTGLGVAMPYLSSVMSGVFVPALNAGITGITNFIGAQMGISTAFDGSEESVRQFTTVLVEGINNQIQGLNQSITAIEAWVNLTRFSLDQFDQRWDQSVIALIVNINQIIAALNSGWIAGNDFFNNFGREMAKLTGNAWSPSEPRQGIAPLTVPNSKFYQPFSPTALPRLGEMTIDWDATVTNPATLAAEQAGRAIATTATQAGQDLTGAVGNFSQAAGDAMDDLAGKVSGAVSGLTNMPGVSMPNMPRQDEANENARRMAAIANEGISGQSWLDEFKAEMPQLYADVMASTDPKSFAQNWVLDFQAGLHPEALDREMIKANIRRMILGEETMAAYVEEISAEIRAENGLAPAATAIVAGVTGALTSQNMGAAVGQATVASVNTPTAVVQFESAGESAFGSWRAGWETAAGGWVPPAPNAPPSAGGATDFTGTDPLTGKPFGLTIGAPGTQMESVGKPPIVVNITGVTANPTAVAQAAGRSVLDALRERGR